MSSSDVALGVAVTPFEADHWVCCPKGLVRRAQLQAKFSCSLCTSGCHLGDKNHQAISKWLPTVLDVEVLLEAKPRIEAICC